MNHGAIAFLFNWMIVLLLLFVAWGVWNNGGW